MIVWTPVMDDIDRELFAWTEVPGWTAVAGWQGQDMYDAMLSFTLEEVVSGSGAALQRRGILWKWQQWGAESFHVKPAEPAEDDFMEACGHLGYLDGYRTEAIEGGGWWIIPEAIDTRPPRVTGDRIVPRKPTRGDGL